MPHLTVNNVMLFYEDEGCGAPLLFVHGWGTSSRVWGAQQAEFVANHRVLSLDWRGCGRSDHPAEGNTIEGVAADLAAFTRALDLDRPVVIGSSIGAAFATELGVRHPELVGGLIAVDGPAYWPSEGVDLGGLMEALSLKRAAFLADWVPRWYAPGSSPALVDWTIRQILDSGTYIDDQLTVLTTYDPRPQLPGLRVPTTYIHGQLDTEIPVQVPYECAAYTPGARVAIIAGAGHMPHHEQPGLFNAALHEALDGTLAARQAA